VGSDLISKINSSPSLIWVVPAIAFHAINVFLGAYMSFRASTARLLPIHKILYFAVVFCLAYYLVLNQFHGENGIWEYLVGLYFITVIPVSKRWDVLLHAFVSIVGLTFLPLLILLQFF